ncbi:Hypothetical predicted protein [Paramuricea clavata]|uniref:Uncharacterized protein n=1 Tax=Paramuricea clavata TaxID=317549 RepID=A0A6S7FNE3_PARCT|nr:Hypothetical predicted protein [Paramuricea clavata]
MFDWEQTKVVAVNKPKQWSETGTEEEQRRVYNIVRGYFCGLYILKDFGDDCETCTYDRWLACVDKVFQDKRLMIDGAYEELLKRYGYKMVFMPNENPCQNPLLYYELAMSKETFRHTHVYDIYKFLDFVYALCDTYKVYSFAS